MNVIDAGSLLASIALWVAIAIALAVAAVYFLRPRVRERYPGGAKRYLLALIVQTAGFMIPIPIVLVVLIGRPVPPGVDVVLGVLAGVAVVALLHFVPGVGALLRDINKTKLEIAIERVSRRRS